MSDLRVLIVDDEPLARARLRRLLGQVGGAFVVGECSDGNQVGSAIGQLTPDLILLDVTMPGHNGFEALERFGQTLPAIVFVTAHPSFAVRAFSIDAVDYLLKPVTAARLGEAIWKVRRFRAIGKEVSPPATQRIVWVHKGRSTVIDMALVETVTANSNYVQFNDGILEVEVRGTLSKIENQLDPNEFTRVHRSILVRQSCVQQVSALHSGRYVLHLKSGRTVSTGRSYKDVIQRSFSLKAFG